MSVKIVQERLETYNCRSSLEEEQALREITQDIGKVNTSWLIMLGVLRRFSQPFPPWIGLRLVKMSAAL